MTDTPRLAIYAVTARGFELAMRLRTSPEVDVFVLEKLRFFEAKGFTSLPKQVAETFHAYDGHIFITAAGIAVRCIAPHLQGKDTDPAVVVLDQEGKFAVSLLSGHLGGANELAERCAAITGGQAVVTTATDSAGLPSLDMLAKERNLVIGNLEAVKTINAALLDGQKVQVYDPGNYLKIKKHDQFVAVQGHWEYNMKRPGVWVSWREDCPFDKALRLYPRVLMLGVGCRRGIIQEEISELLHPVFKEANLSFKSIGGLASIDAKKDETGILDKAASLELEPTFFTREQLDAVEVPNPSVRVEERMGVPSVAEASALLLSEGGEMLVEKTKTERVTLAVARRKTC